MLMPIEWYAEMNFYVWLMVPFRRQRCRGDYWYQQERCAYQPWLSKEGSD